MSAIALDPLIAEARRRARRRRLLALAVVAVAAAIAVAVDMRASSGRPSLTTPVAGRAAQVVNAGSTGPMVWALGTDRFWLTADSGRTWRPLPSSFGTQGRFNVVNSISLIQFVDRDHGWLFSGNGVPYRTTDGGRSWIRIDLARRFAQSASAISFLDPSDGYLLSSRQLLATRDGGVTWKVVSRLPSAYGWGLTFGDRFHGLAISSTTLYATTDGGRTWHAALRPGGRSFELWAPSIFGRRIVAPDLTHVGDGSPDGPVRVVVYSSPDGGRTWTSRSVPTLIPPARDHGTGPPTIGFTALTAGDWIAQRGSTIRVTTNAGRSWRSLHTATHSPGFLDGTGFTSLRAGWAIREVGGPGRAYRSVLVRTTDGGRHWVPAGPREPTKVHKRG